MRKGKSIRGRPQDLKSASGSKGSSLPGSRLLRLSVLLILLPGIGSATAQNLLMPQGRTPIVVPPGARNPFGQSVTAQEVPTVEETETEESRLRRIIGRIKVGGVSGTPERLRVLLGSLVLRPGDTLPPLIERQQEVLRVESITRDFVALTFVEKEAGTEGRLIKIPLSTPPRVTEMLYGEAVERLVNIAKPANANASAMQLKGVQDFLEDSRKADLLNVTDRKFELMGVVKDANQSKSKQDE